MTGIDNTLEKRGARRKAPVFKGFFALLMAAVLLSGGCAAIHRAREAKNPKKIPAGERTVTAEEAGISSGSILTLDHAIDVALKYNPTVVQAQQSLSIAKSEYRNSIAGYLPNVNASASYERGTNNVPNQPASNRTSDSYSASVNLAQLVFDFGKTPFAVRQAMYYVTASEESLRATNNDITYQVTQAYFDLNKAEKLMIVARDTVTQFQLHREQAQVLFEVGRRIRYDITKADVDLGNAQLSLISAENAEKTARAALNQAMGLAESVDYQIETPQLEEMNPSMEDLMEAARENNPTLRALIAQENASSQGIDISIASLFPSVSLGTGISWGGNKFPLAWNWFIGPSINWSIFNGFRNLNLIDEASAELRSARAKRAAYEQTIYMNLSTATTQLSNAKKRLALSNLIVVQAQENMELVNERYKVGRASAVDLTDAETALSSARSNQVQASYDYQSAVAQIMHTVGGQLP